MALIIAIDTSTKACSIGLHHNGDLLAQQAYHLQKSHSSLLPIIINQLMDNVDMRMADLDAVAISAGPGSYTGLRIGTSTAKGICFGLDIPLISFDSLDSMYESVKRTIAEKTLVCPMIDARRMEVFCNLRGTNGTYIWESKPLILEEDTFENYRNEQILLIGDGAEKCQELFSSNSNISYNSEIHPNAIAVSNMVERKFNESDFEDLAYFEPSYLKEYRTIPPKNKLKI